MRDRRRANVAQGFDKTRISLTAARVRHREGWADRDPDLGTWRPGQPTARSIQPIRTEDDRRNNRNTSDAREGSCATLRCGAPENGGSASAYAAFGKDSHNSSGTQALDSDAKRDRKSTRLNSSHTVISYAVFCLKKKNKNTKQNNYRKAQ